MSENVATRFVGCLALVVLGCGASPAVQRTEPAETHTADAPASRADSSKAPSDALIVERPDRLHLFSDEAAQATRVLGAWAKKQGYTIVPPGTVDTLLSRAAAGRDPSNRPCGLPLSEWRATRQYASSLGISGRVDSHVYCNDESAVCKLTVSIRDSSQGGQPNRFPWKTSKLYEAPYDATQHWSKALPLAVTALVPVEMGGGGGYGTGSGHGRAIVKALPEKLELAARMARVGYYFFQGHVATEELTFKDGQRALRACFVNTASEGGETELLLEFEAKGNIARCEPNSTNAPLSLCACRALQTTVQRSSNVAGSRLIVRSNFRAADIVSPAKMRVRASVETDTESLSHDSIEDWQPPNDHRVAQCFAERATPSALAFDVTVHFESRGQAARVDMASNAKGLSEEETACISKRFLTSISPCPEVATSTAGAAVKLEILKLGSRAP